MPAQKKLLLQQIINLAEGVKRSSGQRTIPVHVYRGAMLQRLQRSGLNFCERPLLAVRSSNGRMSTEYTPDFIILDESIDAAVVCLIASSQTRPIDVDRAQACLDAYRENAFGLLINFGGEKLLWSLITQNQRRFYPQRKPCLAGLDLPP